MKKRCHYIKASISVEASLVLPVFLFAVLAFLYFFQIMYLQDMLSEAMTQAAAECSEYAYIYDSVMSAGDEGTKKEAKQSDTDRNEGNSYLPSDSVKENTQNNAQENSVISKLLDTALFSEMVGKYVDKSWLEQSCVEGGYEGIIFYGSSFMEEDSRIQVTASYSLKLPVPDFLSQRILVQQKIVHRGFVGSMLWEGEDVEQEQKDQKEEDQMVYVTATGSCYHKNENCSSIRLKIEQVFFEQVSDRRNASGGKYYPCERCGKAANGSMVYIAKEGDRYHSSMACPGLKRTVSQIELKKAEAEGKRCCKRCGG